MKNGASKFAAAFAIGALSIASIASAAPLVNPGFELDDAQPNMDVAGATGWGGFNSRFTTEQAARTGTQSLKIFGPFFPGGGAGALQSINVIDGDFAPGDLVAASAWGFDAGSADPDGFQGNNFGIVQLLFLDNGGNLIGAPIDSAQINASAPDQVWQLLTASGIAPANAFRAQIVLLHVQANDPVTGGAVFFDDASLAVVPEPSAALALVGALPLVLRRRR
jgi:hypothetical protein